MPALHDEADVAALIAVRRAITSALLSTSSFCASRASSVQLQLSVAANSPAGTTKVHRTQPSGRVLLSDASQLGLRLPDSSIGTTSQWLRLPGQFRQECEHVWLAGFSPDDDSGLEQQCRSLKSLSRFYRTYATIHRVSC